MATAPKANPKVVPIDEAATAASEESAPKKSKLKLYLIIGVVLLALGGGGGAWYFMGKHKASDKPKTSESSEASETSESSETPEKPAEPPKPPVFVTIDPFTVNLQPEDNGEHYLQVTFTLQVADQAQVDRIKLYMPLVRSRVLMLLSGKKASELNSAEGKQKLQEEILAQIKQPFVPQSPPQTPTGVFFTSFVIQ